MLRIYEDALEVVRRTNAIVNAIERRDPDLARQLRKARCSIPLNIGEGSHARGARRNLHHSYAQGSAQECIAILETAHACGYTQVPADVVELLRKIIGTLFKCIGSHR